MDEPPCEAPERDEVERRIDDAYEEGGAGRPGSGALCDAFDEVVVEVVAFESVRRLVGGRPDVIGAEYCC